MDTLADAASRFRAALKSRLSDKGADPRRFKDEHDRVQWDKLKSLPNLVYTDGNRSRSQPSANSRRHAVEEPEVFLGGSRQFGLPNKAATGLGGAVHPLPHS